MLPIMWAAMRCYDYCLLSGDLSLREVMQIEQVLSYGSGWLMKYLNSFGWRMRGRMDRTPYLICTEMSDIWEIMSARQTMERVICGYKCRALYL